ncbi:MAG: NUDIX domain-containing protein, partial [Pseudomonadota bacterium]
MTEPAPLRLAATILLARDGAEGMELSMVVRHHEIDFASGALVFPGGSVDAADGEARAWCDGDEGLSDDEAQVRVAAIREAFEECGVLIATRNGALLTGAEAAEMGPRWRDRLEANEVAMADLAREEGLRFPLDRLTLFSRWITPPMMPKRFDTFFFIAETPAGHALLHDGSEAVDSLWIRPEAALDAARTGEKTILFPTRLNLAVAAEAATV